MRLPLTVVLLAVSAAVACAPAAQELDGEMSYSEVLKTLVQQAESAGVDRQQLELLRTGTIGFPEYQAAYQRYVACVRGAGVSVAGPQVHRKEGYPLLEVGFVTGSGGLSDGQLDALASECQERHSKFVEIAYVSSPAAAAARERLFESLREPILACLRSNGLEIEDDAALPEITRQMDELRDRPPPTPERDCYLQTGYLVQDFSTRAADSNREAES